MPQPGILQLCLFLLLPRKRRETRNFVLIGGYPRGMGRRMQGWPCRPNGTGWLWYRGFILVDLVPHILGKHSTSELHTTSRRPTLPMKLQGSSIRGLQSVHRQVSCFSSRLVYVAKIATAGP